MKKKIIYIILITFLITAFTYGYYHKTNLSKNESIVHTLEGTIISNKNNTILIKDNNNNSYTFVNDKIKENIGTKIVIKYKDDNQIISFQKLQESEIPVDYLDNGIFSDYYVDAYQTLNELSLNEIISQLLLVRYQDNNILNIQKQYQFGGYIFFEKDFKGKTKDNIIKMIQNIQQVSKLPLLTAIDEEGGIVSRLSNNQNIVSEPFKSSQELYKEGGFTAIKEDVIKKSQILYELGLNLNLAPVVDVSTNPNDYIYKRTLGLDTSLTSIYSETVINASKGTHVSYTLKHFPGYGNNKDTHKTSSVDSKSLDDIKLYDLPPFISGINAGAEAVMVSHNIINSVDSNNPSSLSLKIHQLLRDDLSFTGVIITDDISMGALQNVENTEVKAILAGNNLIITSNYQKSFNNIKDALNNNLITEENIKKLAFKNIAWKYYKELI